MIRSRFAHTLLAALMFAATALAQAEAPAPLDDVTNMIRNLLPKDGGRCLNSPITVNIRDMDLPQALRLLAQEGGFNIAVGKDVTGTVTCSLDNVPARTALDSFLRANGYECLSVDGVLVVVKQSKTDEDKGGKSSGGIPVKITRKTFRLPYTGAEKDMLATGSSYGGAGDTTAKSMEEVIRSMLSPAGHMSYYERQHVVVVEDDESVVQAIDEFVRVLWTIPDQVFIDSKLLEVSLEEGEDLGIRWNFQNKIASAGKRNQATGAVDATGTLATSTAPSLGLDRFFSFGVTNANITAVVEALGTRKRVDLRSNPRVLVTNHRMATIVVGQEIPYLSSEQAVGGGDSPIRTYAFKEVAVRLEVMPHISDNGIVFMEVHPVVKNVIGYTEAPRQPILSTREAATSVAVNDGSTLIIGGLVQRAITRSWTEVPFVARIPIIGWLFRQKFHDDAKNDLLFLLSPRVVTGDMMQQMMDDNKALTTEPKPHLGESPASNPKW